MKSNQVKVLGVAAGALLLPGVAGAGLENETIDLSGVSFGATGIANMPFEVGPANAYADVPYDSFMSPTLMEMEPAGNPTPAAAPAPLSGLMGAVGLGVLAAQRRRRD